MVKYVPKLWIDLRDIKRYNVVAWIFAMKANGTP